jgi:O-antigen ligase
MSTSINNNQRMAAGEWLIAALLLVYPAASMALDGGASALMIASAVLALATLAFFRRFGDTSVPGDGSGRALCISLVLPIAAVALSTLSHGNPVFPVWDSPSRFIFVIPVFLVLRRVRPQVLAWADISFALGALAALAVVLFASRDWGQGRLGSKFLDPIHFGDLALAFGVLSVVAINWWRKDNAWVVALKVAGLFAGLAVSMLSGSRGGWLALPFVAILVLWQLGRGKSMRWKVLVPLAFVVLLGLIYGASGSVRERIHLVSSDMSNYEHGDQDTSVGVRFQLYKAAWELIRENPVLGLGGYGFRDAMDPLVKQGKLTPVAAVLGKGETHNQMLAYLANYGIVGGLALLAIYLVPAIFFVKRLRSASASARSSALIGLLFVVMFFVFGWTVETFDFRGVTALYAVMVAAFAAISDRTHIAANA